MRRRRLVGAQYLFIPTSPKLSQGWLIPAQMVTCCLVSPFNQYGDRSNAIGKRFGRLKSSLGYGKDYVFHSLRKGFATQLENATIPVTVVARLMGHEIEGQTFGNYSDGLALKGLREAINHLDWSSSDR